MNFDNTDDIANNIIHSEKNSDYIKKSKSLNCDSLKNSAETHLQNPPVDCIDYFIRQAEIHSDCIFCQIVAKKSPIYKIWEDDEHLAFLSIYPNTLGASVVIPKKHFNSYAFHLPDEELAKLSIKSAIVGRLLDATFEDVARTALIYEGFGINHVHAKLFPLHHTNQKEWTPIHTDYNKYFDRYEGYVSSHEYHGENPDLAKLAERIRKTAHKLSLD